MALVAGHLHARRFFYPGRLFNLSSRARRHGGAADVYAVGPHGRVKIEKRRREDLRCENGEAFGRRRWKGYDDFDLKCPTAVQSAAEVGAAEWCVREYVFQSAG